MTTVFLLKICSKPSNTLSAPPAPVASAPNPPPRRLPRRVLVSAPSPPSSQVERWCYYRSTSVLRFGVGNAETVTDDASLRVCGFLFCAGATSGIGAETARVLAKRGARLVLPARSVKAAEETKARILLESPEAEIVVMPLDLSSLASVRRFVAEFESLNLPLNLLMYVHISQCALPTSRPLNSNTISLLHLI